MQRHAAARDDLKVASAGTKRDAEVPLSAEFVRWADLIVVVERTHRTRLQPRYRDALMGTRLICIDIPYSFAFINPELVEMPQARVARHLPPDDVQIVPHGCHR